MLKNLSFKSVLTFAGPPRGQSQAQVKKTPKSFQRPQPQQLKIEPEPEMSDDVSYLNCYIILYSCNSNNFFFVNNYSMQLLFYKDDQRFGIKLDQGTSESDSDSEMYPPPEGVDCDFSMEDSMGKYF